MYCSTKPVVIRKVWAGNLLQEMSIIHRTVLHYPFVSMDTEFPGVIFCPRVEKHLLSHLPPRYNYMVMKANVDVMEIIQLGLTLSDAQGNLPDFGTNYSYIWEFNFRDFDVEFDLQNTDSIAMLKQQGIDFYKNRNFGIDSGEFARLLLNSRLLCNFPSTVTWLTFHSAYDFGFLLKILTRRRLPDDLGMFMTMVNWYFGSAVYDMKHMIRYCQGLCGGLDRVAKTLGVHRIAGKSHQAGSDSLLTMQTFLKLKKSYFNRERGRDLVIFQSVLYGLEVERIIMK